VSNILPSPFEAGLADLAVDCVVDRYFRFEREVAAGLRVIFCKVINFTASVNRSHLESIQTCEYGAAERILAFVE